jgi:predicted DNA binding CopG/RHH family protein
MTQKQHLARFGHLRIEQDLLNAFRARARLAGTPYQTQIKVLMKAWVQDQEIRRAPDDEA